MSSENCITVYFGGSVGEHFETFHTIYTFKTCTNKQIKRLVTIQQSWHGHLTNVLHIFSFMIAFFFKFLSASLWDGQNNKWMGRPKYVQWKIYSKWLQSFRKKTQNPKSSKIEFKKYMVSHLWGEYFSSANQSFNYYETRFQAE